jgi:hypothetical protein
VSADNFLPPLEGGVEQIGPDLVLGSKSAKTDRPTTITLIERLGPELAIGADAYQWIVLRAVGPGCAGYRGLLNWQGLRWCAVGFIASSRLGLIACIKAKGLKLTAAGRRALAPQDERIARWRK